VLGGVNQQTDHRRRQLKAANAPRFEQSGFRGVPKLREGAVDLPFEGRYERGGLFRWRSRLRFCIEESPLLVGEPFTPRIREKPVQTARGMAYVESHGSRSTGTSPEVGGRERLHDPAHLLRGLKQGMGDGLQQGRDLGDEEAAEPDFGWGRGCHGGNIAEAAIPLSSARWICWTGRLL
jgi:hypothetical protein